ncbi:hypothetical protein H2200_006730 [Cladophialophora chaetospira]|uniref:Uncharacterized protein n=1 Tax=Cladophialophora chaetospira TaxID=386627 RepID=A0AA38X8Y0_9EURO|nr:hypothetical protein H2200_006730 [Cladophialophora chaetospira]
MNISPRDKNSAVTILAAKKILTNFDCGQTKDFRWRHGAYNQLVSICDPQPNKSTMLSPFSLLLTLSFLFFLNPSLLFCHAQAPKISFLGNTPDAQIQRTMTALQDTFHIVRVAALTFCSAEPVFLRYFQPNEATFVRNIFRQLANIPLDQVITSENVVDLITSPPYAGLNQKLEYSWILLDQDPYQKCVDPGYNAYMHYDNPQLDALIILCDHGFRWPSIEEIANPPQTAWARDSQGHPLPGYSCDNLGTFDSDWMKTMGAVILHEYLHWGFYFTNVPGWHLKIAPDPAQGGKRDIEDYAGQLGPPAVGSGPYNAKLINDNYGNTGQPFAPTLNNVENYVWFAVSKYWSWRCGRDFAAAPSGDAASKREASGFRPFWP